MAILKCKMCGGDIVLNEEKTFYICESCGTSMTLPKVSDEQRAALFNRGNHFRRIGEFDKALAIYENIVREDDTDAEAHWCCVLCRFGIEYVEDPNTFEYLPTCHRASFDSILEDVDYLAALEHSDGITKKQYQKDAIKISEVQKGILTTSQNEEPYDVFICYKETDDNTKERTRDSVDAQEIYYQLTQEGYRVFFSRISLEDKAGTEFEPYIFAALNSAKVMVVVGSKPEYLNAVWVKNEWSRFIALMKKDRGKLLLPCYKDMDPYDLPEQLSVLQSYDMTKIGFIQDLIRGIRKVVGKETTKTEANTDSNDENSVKTTPLLKRVFMFLEDENWIDANNYCEKVLDQEPENPEAYLGKLMAELHVSHREDFAKCEKPFIERLNFQKIARFGDEKIIAELTGYNDMIIRRNENNRLETIYNEAVKMMDSANTEEEYESASFQFISLKGFRDSESLASKCTDRIEELRKKKELEKVENSKRIGQITDAIRKENEKKSILEELRCISDREKKLSQKGFIFKKKKDSNSGESDELTARKNWLISQLEGNYSKVEDIQRYNDAFAAYLLESDVRESVNPILFPNIDKDSVAFGKYIQRVGEEPDPIEWKIIRKEKDKVLLISKFGLDCKPFHAHNSFITWETCSLRKWLNNNFLYMAFDEQEQKRIVMTTVSNRDTLDGTGNSTNDKVFLLSVDEAKSCFDSNAERTCFVTKFCCSLGAGDYGCNWWLRTIKHEISHTAISSHYVDSFGVVNFLGMVNTTKWMVVRPAIWLSVNS